MIDCQIVFLRLLCLECGAYMEPQPDEIGLVYMCEHCKHKTEAEFEMAGIESDERAN